MNLPKLGQALAPGLQKLSPFRRRGGEPPPDTLPRVFLVVEGQNDIQFLQRISGILHAEDSRVPDLQQWQLQRKVMFVPSGGGDSHAWRFRLTPLGRPQFFLFDRDVPPVTERRLATAEMLNSRPNCIAVLTQRRALENYLHGDAIFEASGVRVSVSGSINLADSVARLVHERAGKTICWESLPGRARKRQRDRAKQWLNTRAVDRMTPARLAESDPAKEICSWLEAIARLATTGTA